ncbi:CHRD domain-containing protein [Aestuariibaculum sediminum]|uniref:CHRD domain-containing protein n=1 Tax=Aestuariibaculum sediminum TaxID=2770637 RepID=A0A8J6UCS9_9FLAO|nr:CHRD domain-containing protein [Aestuariibaculum sediminum]MBD0832469.1 CHRD domain-containing protein [Aestuariibaculum sediminum]
MKSKTFFTKSKILLFVLSMMIYSCSNESMMPQEDIDNAVNSKMSLKKNADNSTKFHFTTSLKSSNEVPPNDSQAAGVAIVTINKEETMIHYKLIVANIENVRMAHFHKGMAGTNGGVVAWLYNNLDGQPSGPSNGVIAEGYITSEGVIGALAGDMDALIEAIRNGEIYVNVHTQAVGSGEIRGQL